MSRKILVIDDSLMVRQQVTRALTGAGFTVIGACDGVDALEKLVTNTDVKLVVCDVNMPRMSGLEFLEKVQPGLPVVMLTTEGEPEMIARAKALGAKGWILKPFKPELVVATAQKLAIAA
ncbi:MAG TPA: response regulator [Kofleriaceae bacterium]|jgi:two-component system chemotaxis response regulator CheY